jgi:glycerate dehydrogenase
MTIIVLDGYTLNPGDLSWDGLKELGTLTVYDRTPHDAGEIIKRIGNAEIVYTNKTPLTNDILRLCPSVRFIGVLATGYDVVDVAAAKQAGITVCNIPAYGTDSVAQFTIAMLLELCHHVADHNDAVHRGEWESSPDFCFWKSPLIELAGKTMGIIGYGRIGQATGRIAGALNMKVVVYSGERPHAPKPGADFVSLDELLRVSDVIALHCPSTPQTKGMINKASIEKMRDGVIILNNSRGSLIVEQDLADALNSGKVYAAGLDVAATEPIQRDNPLITAKNCLITPHISWAPKESRQRLMDIAVANLSCFLSGHPQNMVDA